MQANCSFQRARNYMHMSLSKEFPTLNTHSATKPQNLPVCNYTGHKALNAQDIHSLVLWSPNPTIICPSVLFTGVWPHELSALEKKKHKCVFCLLLKHQFKDTASQPQTLKPMRNTNSWHNKESTPSDRNHMNSKEVHHTKFKYYLIPCKLSKDLGMSIFKFHVLQNASGNKLI